MPPTPPSTSIMSGLRRSARLVPTATSYVATNSSSTSTVERAAQQHTVPVAERTNWETATVDVNMARPSPRKPKRARIDISSTGGVADALTDAEALASGSSARTKRRKKSPPPSPDRAGFPERPVALWKIGPHVSAAGGVENAVVNAASIGATAFALFLKSQRKWESKDMSQISVEKFKERLKAFGYGPECVLPHGNYLVNLGNPDAEKRNKSYECFIDDLRRCEQLGLRLYNFHPGSTVGQATPSESIALIAQSLNRAHAATQNVITVVENMAGAGNVIGSKFRELGEIIKLVDDKTRVGVCLDTCHMFAAGYDIRTKEGWEKTMAEFDREIGFQYLRRMHLNDSKASLSSKKDRHENIGLGHLALPTFAHILSDPRTQGLPLILETPSFEDANKKAEDGAMDVWRKEVEVLHQLADPSFDNSDEQLGRWTAEIQQVVERRKVLTAKPTGTGVGRKKKAIGSVSKNGEKDDEGEDHAEEEGHSCAEHAKG